MKNEPLYNLYTYDIYKGEYTPQEGIGGSTNLTLWRLRAALHVLRHLGYTAHRIRHNGRHKDSDPDVFVERVKP